jgi:hypothetical protein
MYTTLPTWAKGLALPAQVNNQSTPLASGDPALDQMLGGGFASGQPHEILPGRSGWDDASVTAFALAWLRRHQQTDQRLAIWVMQNSSLYPQGLANLSVDLNRLILVDTARDVDALWTIEQSLYNSSFGLIIGEVENLDLLSSRRLQLAAERHNPLILILRRSRRGLSLKETTNSVLTRWLISPASNLGDQCHNSFHWQSNLTRNKTGKTGNFLMRWHHETHRFTLASPLHH